MALPSRFTGRVNSRSRGVIDAIEKQLKFLNLKPAKKLTFSFNPYQEKTLSIRQVSAFLYRDQVRETNLKCLYKTEVHNSLQTPLLEVYLESGHKVFFKTENLTPLEILSKFNEIISSQHKEEKK